METIMLPDEAREKATAMGLTTTVVELIVIEYEAALQETRAAGRCYEDVFFRGKLGLGMGWETVYQRLATIMHGHFDGNYDDKTVNAVFDVFFCEG